MKKKTITNRFQIRLIIIIAITLLESIVLIFPVSTKINAKNYEDIISTTLVDIEQDIETASDINMLELTYRVKGETKVLLRDKSLDSVSAINAAMRVLVANEGLSEMSVANTDNIIIYSSKDEYIGFDMNASEDTIIFDELNHGATEIVQPVRKNAYHAEGHYDLYNKYAGVPLEGIGYLQIAINPQQFQKEIDEQITYIALNRHIGQTGYVIISNLNDVIISNAGADASGEKNATLSGLGLTFDKNALGKTFTTRINGVKHFCIASFVEGYYIIGVVPVHEVQSFRNRAVFMITLVELVIFALMFFLIKIAINKIIVSKIHNINRGLNKIIEGELDTKVDEYSTEEFSELSDDINSTVSSLKDYMVREQAKIQEELHFARTIQISALPRVLSLAPYRSRFDLYATMDTAKEVGGDFYDFYMLDDSRLAFLIADVSGKGVPAAMFMMTCKSMLKTLMESGLALNEAFDRANEKLCENNEAMMFVTVWMGILDLNTGCLQYVNAGHNSPLFYDENRNFVYRDNESELALIGMPGISYTIREVFLKPGDKIFLYTDGVTEACNTQGKMYGTQRLCTYLNLEKGKPLIDLLSGLKTDIARFSEGAEQFDDITMLAVHYK